jgi:DNA-binding response OmpR family regulator
MSAKRTVMICEDEPDLLDLYTRALRSKFNILPVSSGCECLERYRDERAKGKLINLVLVDYKLGDISGDKVACRIKDLYGTKVVMISGYEPEPNMIDRLKAENCIIEWIKKPVRLSVMILKLEELIG